MNVSDSPIPVRRHSTGIKKINMEQIHGRTEKSTLAGLKLASDSGLMFREPLKDKEYVYLNGAEFGEIDVVRELLLDQALDVNCVDYMGRNALLLAIKNENIDLVDLLVGRLNFYAVEDALLHAISQEKNHLVKLIVDHPQYIRLEKQAKMRQSSPNHRPGNYGKRSQFSSDISPLMLAAHTNNHEIIQLLLDRGVKLKMPHDRSCVCSECERIRAKDSLILELQRLHTYQALSSSAYLALTTSDPISSAFILRDELYQLASQVKQFKEEYSQLAVKCMDFAVSCIDLCRTSDEVHCLLRGDFQQSCQELRHPLDTVKSAIHAREKKFVAHPNCQHQMENLFYHLMFCIRDFQGWQRLQFLMVFVPLLPFLYLIYLFFPQLKVPLPRRIILRDSGVAKYEVMELLSCPVVKFIGHMVSYVVFVTLITVATFRLDRIDITDDESEEINWERRSDQIWSYDFRSNNVVMTKIQIILLFWILGQLCMECKQVYYYGLRYFFRSYYNVMDWAAIALYLASYSLRIIVDFKVQAAQSFYQSQLRMAHDLLYNATTCSSVNLCPPGVDPNSHDAYVIYRNQVLSSTAAYWLRGCRLWWAPDDPEYVSDCLFALGNVLSFARISHLMPAWELIGPLQISLARMISDIIRFMALFTVMVIAFVVGLTNLYWYFANIIISVDAQGHLVRYASGIPAFKSTGATFYTLYWALFGQSSNNVTTIDENLASRYPGHAVLAVDSSPNMINNLGSILYAIYNACMTIILLNMLIAMMSKSFDEIQGDRLEEWKFARASLWMVYIDQEGVLPPPLNLLPSRLALASFCCRLRQLFPSKPLPSKIPKSVSAAFGNVVFHNHSTEMMTLDELDQTARPPKASIRKTITTNTVSTAVDCLSTTYSNDWISEGSADEDESQVNRSVGEFKQYTDLMRADVIRRYLFQLQKQKEEVSKSADMCVVNYQRQQSQLEKESRWKTDVTRDGEPTKLDYKGRHPEDERLSTDSFPSPNRPEADNAGVSVEDSRMRGLSSLLMPPSVRKKLEAVAAVAPTDGTNLKDSMAAADAVARFYLLETTRKDTATDPLLLRDKAKKASVTSWKAHPSYEDPFTARTVRPLSGAHLRELYKVEQEMHDMSEALSSRTFSQATISEINELETSPAQ